MTKPQNETMLDLVADRAHAAYVTTLGTSAAPTRDDVRESVAAVLKYINHPDYIDQDYFTLSGGALLHVERRDRHWDNFQIYVPATKTMLWYKEKD